MLILLEQNKTFRLHCFLLRYLDRKKANQGHT